MPAEEAMAVTAVVYVNGQPGPQAVPDLGRADVAIAADAGFRVAAQLGHHVDLLVGDLDSIGPDDLAAARASGIEIDQHPPDKDLTDLELAIDHVRRAGADRLIVLGGAGGRLDHLAANLAVLAGPRLDGIEVEAYLGDARVDVIRDRRVIVGRAGMVVSLLAWGGPARGVSTEGLRWPLAAATLEAGSALGTSNEFVAETAVVSVSAGVVTAITPDVGSIHPTIEVTQ
jgi:thiamine pyrophosphokinase